jgi:hypothetical protein
MSQLRYNDVRYPRPLLSQSNKGRAFKYHSLNGLHNRLELNGVEVRIQILDHSIIGRPSIECFWSPDSGISGRAVLRGSSRRGHHDNEAALLDGILICTSPDLGIIISWIIIGGCCWWWWARCLSRWLEDRRHNHNTLNKLDGAYMLPCIRIQTWVGTACSRWDDRETWSLSICRRKALWCWPCGQHLEISIFPDSKRQWLEGELGAVRELDVEYLWCHDLSGRIFERFPLPGAPLLTSRHQMLLMRIGRNVTIQDQSQGWTRWF